MTFGLHKIYNDDSYLFAAAIPFLGPLLAMQKSSQKINQTITLIEENIELSKKCDKNVCSSEWVNTCLVHNLRTIQENNQKIKVIDAYVKKCDVIGGVSSIVTSTVLVSYVFKAKPSFPIIFPSVVAYIYSYTGIKMLKNGLK